MNRQRDVAAGVGVLRGVGQQIREHLRESRVAVDDQRLVRDPDLEVVLLAVEQRARDLDRLRDRVAQIDGRPLELDLAARDPRDVEQVVDQVRSCA